MPFPKYVKIVEVGPRDGLQNEAHIIPTHNKIEFVNQLSDTGLSVIEATSFVSPKWIPALADHREVFLGIHKKPHVSYPVLVPNSQGLQEAMSVGAQAIAVFTTPSEQFSKHNTNCTVSESLERIQKIVEEAKSHHLQIRAYISCVLGCPYEGEIAPEKVVELSQQLFAIGCTEISLGDTIGVGTPLKTKYLIEKVLQKIPIECLAVHFHDTYGQALVNIYAALECGISIVDSSIAGLGGCPYAKGASGNVATEDAVYLLHGMGIQTGIDFKKLIAVGRYISQVLKRRPQSKVNIALGGEFAL